MNLFFKPALGADGKPLLVRDPMTQKPLDAAGEWKTNSQFWIRRVRDKEVIDATVSQKATPAPAPAPSPEPSPAPSPEIPTAEPIVPPLNLIKPTA